MTKQELSDKLAGLYGIKPYFQTIVGFDVNEGNVYADLLLIDDWNALMPLVLKNKVSLHFAEVFNAKGANKEFVYTSKTGVWIIHDSAYFEDHESPEDAASFVLAMALVKLAERKS